MFCIEASVIAIRPILTSFPIVVILVAVMLRARYMEAETFVANAPYMTIALFMLAILGFVALAYYLAWRSMRNISLAETLKSDVMM